MILYFYILYYVLQVVVSATLKIGASLIFRMLYRYIPVYTCTLYVR